VQKQRYRQASKDNIVSKSTRDVVAAFDSSDSLGAAVFALETHGFDRAAFSVLASEEALQHKLGHRYQHVKEVEDDPQVPRDTFFSRISRLEAEFLPTPGLASVGFLMLAGVGSGLAAVIAAGGGALIGVALGRLIHQQHATRVKEQLAQGGLLLWVNVRDAAEEAKAADSDEAARGFRNIVAH
jgi:hypothetical protein